MAQAYRTWRSSEYGYECLAELTVVPGLGITRVNVRRLGGEFELKLRILSTLHGCHVLT